MFTPFHIVDSRCGVIHQRRRNYIKPPIQSYNHDLPTVCQNPRYNTTSSSLPILTCESSPTDTTYCEVTGDHENAFTAPVCACKGREEAGFLRETQLEEIPNIDQMQIFVIFLNECNRRTVFLIPGSTQDGVGGIFI